MLANPTFPANEYHRSSTLSLLCSEWEEVGHVILDHQQMKCFFLLNILYHTIILKLHNKIIIYLVIFLKI